MDWVDSVGGPLICAERSVAAGWRGTDGLSTPGASQESDYWRACATRAYLEAIPCGAGLVLVLGDAPMQSSFFHTASGDPAIARWVYGPSDDEAEAFLAGPAQMRTDLAPPLRFEMQHGALIIFDSAWPGAEAVCSAATLQPGAYRVTTEEWKQEDAFDFIVHRFLLP